MSNPFSKPTNAWSLFGKYLERLMTFEFDKAYQISSPKIYRVPQLSRLSSNATRWQGCRACFRSLRFCFPMLLVCLQIRSIMVVGGDDGTSPNQMRAFTNRDNLDFESVADLAPLQVSLCISIGFHVSRSILASLPSFSNHIRCELGPPPTHPPCFFLEPSEFLVACFSQSRWGLM